MMPDDLYMCWLCKGSRRVPAYTMNGVTHSAGECPVCWDVQIALDKAAKGKKVLYRDVDSIIVTDNE
jgi:hypothetical protein